MKKLSLLFVLPLLLTLAGCGEKAPVGAKKAEAAHTEGEKFTLFTEATELFLEMPPLVAGKPATLSVSLTRLSDFKPVKEGRLEVVLAGGAGAEERFASEATPVAGVYKPVLTPKQAGEREMTLVLKTAQGEVAHELGPVTVFASAAEAAKAHGDHERHEEGITFTKEQQWKIDFATVEAVKGMARPSVAATATIRAQPDGEAQLVAPVAGVIRPVRTFPRVGEAVKKGQVLATLSPRLGGETDQATLDAGASKAMVALEQARRERERMERLYKEEAIPEKRLAEARANEQVALAESGAAQARASQLSGGAGIAIRAPVSGLIADVSVASGAYVAEGAPMFHVANTGRLWLEARVPESEIGRLGHPAGAAFSVDGFDGTFNIDTQSGRLVAVGSVVDAATRTVPVIFEFNNPSSVLRIGMTVRAQLFSGSAKEALLVPASAIQDESGTQAVYVQTGGESFERKIVQTGARDGSRIAILSGLESGQRVVSKGAYLIRLSTSKSGPAGHAH